MGYTSYFQQLKVPTDVQWQAIKLDAEKIISEAQASNIPLAFEWDEPGKPPFLDKDLIRFNGIGECGHETFYLPRVMEKGYRGEPYRFNFCKTACKAYDAPVGAILISMNHHAPGVWDIASDGARNNWMENGCIELYETATGRIADTSFLDPCDEVS